MISGRPPDELSGPQQLLSLPLGGCYARAAVIPSNRIDGSAISNTLRTLSSTMSTAIIRARSERPGRNWRIHSARAFTSSLDVIVTVAAIREA